MMLNIAQKNVEEKKMKEISIILPNQLHENIEFLKKNVPIYLIEEFLFFKQFNFHKQKLIFHRSSMKSYENYLTTKGYFVSYIESKNPISEIRNSYSPWKAPLISY